MPESPVRLPAGYAPAFAVGYADESGNLVLAGIADPLPVTLDSGTIEVVPVESAPPPAPLSGSASASGLAGPFAPVAGRAVTLALSGTWDGTVQLTRSTDEGASRLPLTAAGLPWGIYTANICEQAWFESEDGAELYLEIALDSGEVDYRIAQ
jgi:hypothetical protein